MQFSILPTLASLLTLVSFSSARIYGFIGPSTPISQGVPFDVTFKTENYITNNEQYYAIFGLTTRTNIGNTIGSAPVANADIFKYANTGKRNFTISITVDHIYSKATEQTLATAIFGQVGASGGITVQYFNVTVPVNPPSTASRK